MLEAYPRLLSVSVHNKSRAEGFDGSYPTVVRAVRDVRGREFTRSSLSTVTVQQPQSTGRSTRRAIPASVDTSTRADHQTATGQFRWPPAGSYMTADGQDLMAADTERGDASSRVAHRGLTRLEPNETVWLPFTCTQRWEVSSAVARADGQRWHVLEHGVVGDELQFEAECCGSYPPVCLVQLLPECMTRRLTGGS